MNRLHLLLIPTLLLAGTGCVTSGGGDADRGRAVFRDMQAAVLAAGETVGDSVAYVQLNVESQQNRTLMLLGRAGGTSGNKTLAGVVLDQEGHVLVTSAVDRKKLQRATIWIGDEELPARLVAVDEGLQLSLFKLSQLPQAELVPLNLDDLGTLSPGAWAVGLEPKGENQDFTKTSELGFVTGLEDGPYRNWVLSGVSLLAGSPVLDFEGRVAGFATKSRNAVDASDIREDIRELVTRGQADVPAEDDDQNGKGWMGVTHLPLNTDYARKHGLPRSTLLLTRVMEGSPAADAGLREGDIVIAVNGRPLRFTGRETQGYFTQLLRPREGKPFTITAIREDTEQVFEGVLGAPPKPETLLAKDLGVNVQGIHDTDVARFNLWVDEGVYVTDIERGSPAAVSSERGRSLIAKGDVITALNGSPTPDLDTFNKVLQDLRRDDPEVVLVAYTRGRTAGLAALNLALGEQE